jgi:hypothetical protein
MVCTNKKARDFPWANIDQSKWSDSQAKKHTPMFQERPDSKQEPLDAMKIIGNHKIQSERTPTHQETSEHQEISDHPKIHDKPRFAVRTQGCQKWEHTRSAFDQTRI